MRNGVSRHRVLLIKIVLATGMQSNGTGPASRQLQDKVGGVAPAGLFLAERRAEIPDLSAVSSDI